MSKNDSFDRVRGPELHLSATIDADDTVLVLGLIGPESTDGDGDGDTGEPTLVTVDGILDDAAAEQISASLAALGATGKHGEVHRFPAPASVPVELIVTVGLGAATDLDDADKVRQAAGIVARSLDGRDSVATTLSDANLAAAAEGFFLGAYRFEEFRSDKSRSKKAPLSSVTLLVEERSKEARAELAHAAAVADCVALARDFVNTPPSHLYPQEFADRARILAGGAGLKVEILDDTELEKNGYGGIVGVGKGSSRLPRLVRLTHNAGKDAKTVALVGKGITFDSGGLSLKSGDGMMTMKMDKGGGAAVLAAMCALPALKVRQRVSAYVPLTDNMPGPDAQRPGDVFTAHNGKTVEVLNTDAEGRLVLADALSVAADAEPDAIIDLATLTGAVMVALGQRIAGLMGNNTDFSGQISDAAKWAGESVWELPLPEEYRSALDSPVADLKNIGGDRYGGALTAGLFLSEFVPEGMPWAHLDIAGTAWSDSDTAEAGKGGTGFGVRTLLRLVERFSVPAAG